jgi:hypothetical protein
MASRSHRLVLALITAICVVIASVFALSYLGGLTDEEPGMIVPSDSPDPPLRGFYMGVLPTPAEGQTFEDAYSQAADYCEIVPIWGKPTPFFDLAEVLSGSWGETFVTEYTRGNGMAPLVHFSFIGPGMSLLSPPEISNPSLSDVEWREAYKQAVIDVVQEIRPLYVSVGNEVNRWFEEYGAGEDDPNGFHHFVSLYEEVYDEVKAVSNQSVVFCTFAREIVSELRVADMAVLDMFDSDRLDLLVLTSYPHSVQGINSPQDISEDYYSSAMDKMPGKSLGFSELGWPSISAFGGEQGQADFLNASARRLTTEQGLPLQMLCWAWMHDIDDNDDLGLIKRDGTPKSAYQAWIDISVSEA